MIIGFSHLQLVVRDVDTTSAWYQRALGMDEFARGDLARGRYVALRHPTARFVIGMQTALGEATTTTGIDHVSFTVANRTDLHALRERLLDSEIDVGHIFDEAASHNMRATDPDGLVIEFTAPRD